WRRERPWFAWARLSSASVARIEVRVTPRAARTEIVGHDSRGRLLVRLAAPPVDGKANEMLIELLAATFGVPKRRVAILRGDRGRNKIVEVEDMQEDELKRLLGNMKP